MTKSVRQQSVFRKSSTRSPVTNYLSASSFNGSNMRAKNGKCTSEAFMPYFTSLKSLKRKDDESSLGSTTDKTVSDFSGAAVAADDYKRGMPVPASIDLFENAQKRAKVIECEHSSEQCNDQHNNGDNKIITGTVATINSVYNRRQQEKGKIQERQNSSTQARQQSAAVKSDTQNIVSDNFDSSSNIKNERYFSQHARQYTKSGVGRNRKISGSGRSISALPTKSFLPITSRHTDNVSHIKKIQIGTYLIDVWYLSPYPEEYSKLEVLYICEFCLKYMKGSFVAHRHKLKCPLRYPPGDEIYRDSFISIFEVDGKKNKTYCQNLCLLAKMFLDHKTLYYDVEPFLFYIMTETDKYGCHFVGYFSKEKKSAFDYNLSCIMTLPSYQRKGYGQFLIDFSYLLSRREGKVGSPEKPLSTLGLITYRKYWFRTIQTRLMSYCGQSTTLDALSKDTGMTIADIITTLELNNMVEWDSSSSQFRLVVPQAKPSNSYDYMNVRDTHLIWTPYINSSKNVSKCDNEESNPLEIQSTASNNNQNIPRKVDYDQNVTFEIAIQQLPSTNSEAHKRSLLHSNLPEKQAGNDSASTPAIPTTSYTAATPTTSLKVTASTTTSPLHPHIPLSLTPSPNHSSADYTSRSHSSVSSINYTNVDLSQSSSFYSLSPSAPYPSSSRSSKPTSAHTTPQASPITATVRAPTKRTLSSRNSNNHSTVRKRRKH